MIRLAPALSLALVLLAATLAPATAQERRPSHCIALADAAPGIEYLHKAGYRDPLPDHTVRIRYVTHASFLIQAGGLSAVTDYAGFLGSAPFVPDVVTMNHAHSSHWTPSPDPRIPHVLRGWGDEAGPADHRLSLDGALLVRNVPTDIRSFSGREVGGNSIFIFEVAGLCIGHLGHLHHEPSEAQYAAIGRLDVVMAPVDGGMTLDLPTMIRVLKRLKAQVVLPMHWFGRSTLEVFLTGMSDEFEIEVSQEPELTLSLRKLPRTPKVLVLPPRYMQYQD
mgnify:CR=1 FL=1